MKKYLLFLVLCLSFTAGQAAEYTVDATVEQEIFYDDNVRLSEDRAGSFGYVLTPIIYFSRNTENLEISADASYGVQRYLVIEELNQEFQRYGFQTNYRTEKSVWGVDADFSILPLRNSAQQDSGDFGTTAETTNWSVAPSYSYQITELDQLTLSGVYSETSISSSDPNSGNLSDFINHRIDLDWERQWTERYSTIFNVFYSRFESMPILNVGRETTSDSYGVNLSSAFNLMENWDVDATIGGRITKSDNTVTTIPDPTMPMIIITTQDQQTNIGFLADLALNYTGERLAGRIFWSRALTPSTRGQLNEQSSIGLDLGYQITQRLDLDINTSYLVTEAVSTDVSVERKNLNIETALSWQMTPDWTLVGAHDYRMQDTSGARSRSVTSNIFSLSINYNWPGLSTSR